MDITIGEAGQTPFDIDAVDFDAQFEAELDSLEQDPSQAMSAEDEGVSGYVGAPHDYDLIEEQAKARAARPAAERIAELYARMVNHHRVLNGILAFCSEPRREGELQEKVAELTASSFSIYDSASYCRLLHDAGALKQVDESGEDYCPESAKPRTLVDEDGVEYLDPQAGACEPFWLATEEGAQTAAADNPASRLESLFEDKSLYLPIFKRVLLMCSEETGCPSAAIGEKVNDDPLLQEPRYFATYFVEKLEGCDALEWRNKAWHTTDLGLEALSMLADVDDAPASAEEVAAAPSGKRPRWVVEPEPYFG